jgi:hypothetical protein
MFSHANREHMINRDAHVNVCTVHLLSMLIMHVNYANNIFQNLIRILLLGRQRRGVQHHRGPLPRASRV